MNDLIDDDLTSLPSKERPNKVGPKVTPLIPQDIDTTYRVAKLYFIGKVCPPDCKSAEEAFARIMAGAELGVGPLASIQNISSINNRTTVWGDLMLALVENSGLLDDIEEYFEGDLTSDDFKAVCRVQRKGRKTIIVNEFSVADAKKANLWTKAGTPWITQPKRMLKMRARSFSLRDGFPDVLKGVYSREEMMGDPMIDATARTVATAEELNRTYLSHAPAEEEKINDASPPDATIIEHDATADPLSVKDGETEAAAPTANDERGQEEADIAEPASASDSVDIPMNADTNYALMSKQDLIVCARQAGETLAEFKEADPSGIAAYWTSVNGGALLLQLNRKGLIDEKLRLEAALA